MPCFHHLYKSHCRHSLTNVLLVLNFLAFVLHVQNQNEPQFLPRHKRIFFVYIADYYAFTAVVIAVAIHLIFPIRNP